MEYHRILENSPYHVEKAKKREILNDRLYFLTKFHYDKCEEYKRLVDVWGYNTKEGMSYEDLPFVPIRLFKSFHLKSIPDNQIVKTMTSSGTTGQEVSKIYLDKETALNQQKTLVQIMEDFIPELRLPMLIIDTERVIKDRNFFSARKAGVMGFSLFGKEKLFALDDNMQLKVEEVRSFLKKYEGKTILAFGYTYIVWQHLYEVLKKEDITLDLQNVILFHGGGWKKLVEKQISPMEFAKKIFERTGIKNVHDFYGMVEQTGSIYVTCEHGHMHASTYSEILIRRAKDFSICEVGEKGIIQLLSLLPQSYPGQ